MKRFFILLSAVVLFSTAAKAEWTPGTVALDRFQQGLNNAAKEPTTAEVYSHLKSQLRILIGWTK
jgi:hypothetical protein